MDDAVIFYQSRGAGEVVSAVKCANRWNAGSVIVIGDRRYEPDADWIDERKLSHDYDALESAYSHRSPNPRQFEIVCIRRWFAILRAMQLYGIKRAFCCDTDCLLFCNPFAEPHLKDCDLTLSTDYTVGMMTAGMSMHTVKSLEIYRDFVLGRYFSDGVVRYGSNDLGAWSDLILRDPAGKDLRMGETNRVIDGSIWDHHMGVTDGWKVGPDGGKLVSFHHGQPYSVRADGQVVRLCGLHCWSRFRPRIGPYLRASAESAEWK